MIRSKGISNNFPDRLATNINSARYDDVFSLPFARKMLVNTRKASTDSWHHRSASDTHDTDQLQEIFVFPLNRTEEAVRKYRAKFVFVATGNDPMLDELKIRLKGLNVSKCREIIVMITAQ